MLVRMVQSAILVWAIGVSFLAQPVHSKEPRVDCVLEEIQKLLDSTPVEHRNGPLSTDSVSESTGPFRGKVAYAYTSPLGNHFQLLALQPKKLTPAELKALVDHLRPFADRVDQFVARYRLKFRKHPADRRDRLLDVLTSGDDVMKGKRTYFIQAIDDQPNRANVIYLSVSNDTVQSTDNVLATSGHEFGHQIIYENSLFSGRYTDRNHSAFGAYGFESSYHEGFSDFISYLFSGRTEVFRPNGKLDRAIINRKSYAFFHENEAHQAGEVVSGIFYDLFQKIGEDAVRVILRTPENLDAAFFRSWSQVDLQDLKRALLQADKDLFGSKHHSLIEKTFLARRVPRKAKLRRVSQTPQGQRINYKRDDILLTEDDFIQSSPEDAWDNLEKDGFQRWKLFTMGADFHGKIVLDKKGNPFRILERMVEMDVAHSKRHGGAYKGSYRVIYEGVDLNSPVLERRKLLELEVSSKGFESVPRLRLSAPTKYSRTSGLYTNFENGFQTLLGSNRIPE